jgi:hypothetical protein
MGMSQVPDGPGDFPRHLALKTPERASQSGFAIVHSSHFFRSAEREYGSTSPVHRA